MKPPLPPDHDPDRIHFAHVAPDADEPAEELPTRPARRVAVTVPWLLAAVLAASVAGFFIGDHQRSRSPTAVTTTTSRPTATTSPPDTTKAAPLTYLTTTDNKCSAQVLTHRLQLGVEIQNQGNTEVELRSVTPVFPLRGLQAVITQRGTCGQPPTGAIAGTTMEPGSTVWVATTVTVLHLHCPAPLPVEFEVSYTSAGRERRERLSGFGDLGNVPYSGCRH
jgi:hypothetical protein